MAGAAPRIAAALKRLQGGRSVRLPCSFRSSLRLALLLQLPPHPVPSVSALNPCAGMQLLSQTLSLTPCLVAPVARLHGNFHGFLDLFSLAQIAQGVT